MFEQIIQRAELLIHQGKYKQAGELLAGLLAENPDNRKVLILMSEVQLQTNNSDEADRLISIAIGNNPDDDYLQYLKARVLLKKEKFNEAENYLKKATSINPYSADYFATWAMVKLHRKQFETALEYAENALELNSENILALNTRSSALLKLKRSDDAFKTIEGALREDPENAFTHANYGWNLLENGNHNKALKHFSIALHSDPTLEYAQAGMMQALKARYLIYRLFLKYAFWMGNMSGKYQWGVIIGFYILYRILNSIAINNPNIEPFIVPILILMALLAFSTWIIAPVSNLFLRLNKFGKHLLDKREKQSSDFVGISLIVAGLSVILYFATNINGWLALSILGLTMMIPFSIMYKPAKRKNVLVIYAYSLLAIGLFSVFVAFLNGELINNLSTIYILGLFVFQIVANTVAINKDNK